MPGMPNTRKIELKTQHYITALIINTVSLFYKKLSYRRETALQPV